MQREKKKSYGPDFSTVRKSASGSVMTYQRVFSSLVRETTYKVSFHKMS